MGVNAEAEALWADVGSVDCAEEWETGDKMDEVWATEGEVSGLVEGQMDEPRVWDDGPDDWAAEEEDTREGGRVEEEYAEDGVVEARTRPWWSADSSVISVSSVLFGISLCKELTVINTAPEQR